MKKRIKDIDFEINEKEQLEDGEKYEITLTIPETYGWLEDTYFIIRENDENKMIPLEYVKDEDGKVTFKGEVSLPTRALYNYFLSFKANGLIHNITKYHIRNDFDLSDSFKLSVNFDVPDWAQGATMYQIFVDRFNRGSSEEMKPMARRHIHNNWDEDMMLGPDEEGIWNNDFYGGDIKGITKKLDYIESLGIDIIYLCPICYSQSTHRYDVSDYEEIDPYAGTKKDLKELCDEAHKRGMHVILDAVFDHTGSDSKYYNEYNAFDTLGAYHSTDSPYAPFYLFKRDNFGNIIYENGRPQHKFWWGQTNMPQCDCASKEWQEYITGENGVIDQWMQLGIDGLRLDVADELSDEFVALIRKAVKRNKKDGYIIGEVWEQGMQKGRSSISSAKGMDSIMNYNFMDALLRYFSYGDTTALDNKIKEILYEYPDPTMFSAMNYTSTHDISRAINLLHSEPFSQEKMWYWDLKDQSLDFCKNYHLTEEERQEAIEKLKTLLYTLTFFPGIVSTFAGDEVGVEGIGNLCNRKTLPWDNIDENLLSFFREMGQIRKEEPFLRQADLRVQEITPEHFSFERLTDDDQMFISINRTNTPSEIILPSEYETPSKVYTLKKSTPRILTPYGGIALKK